MVLLDRHSWGVTGAGPGGLTTAGRVWSGCTVVGAVVGAGVGTGMGRLGSVFLQLSADGGGFSGIHQTRSATCMISETQLWQ